MTDIREQSAIRNRLYLAGVDFDRGPRPIGFAPRRFEAKTSTSSLGLRVDRPYAGVGLPNVPVRHDITTVWPDIRESALLEHLGILTAIGQPFDACIWKQTRDVYDGDGATTDFVLQRRAISPTVNLPDGIPATSFADYETRVDVYTAPYGTIPLTTPTSLTLVHKTNATIGTGSPGSGEAWIEDDGHSTGDRIVAALRLHTAPSAASDVLVVTYIPLYRVVIDQEQARSYAEKLQEPRGLKLVEV